MQILIPLIIGVLAGTASGLFGIGGGVLIVPMLIFFYKFPQHSATATSLVALLLPVGILGVWQYYNKGHIDMSHVKVGALIAVGMFAGALFGARIAVDLASGTLTKMFAVFLVIVAVRLWWTAS
jgi:uncharacterized protein